MVTTPAAPSRLPRGIRGLTAGRGIRASLTVLALTGVAVAFAGCPTPHVVDPDDGGGSSVVYERPKDETPPVPAGPPSVADARALLRLAAARAAAGDRVGEQAALAEVTETAPNSLEADAARVSLAEHAIERGDFAAAKALAEDVQAPPEAPDEAARLELAVAKAEEGLEAFATAARRFSAALGKATEAAVVSDAARGLARTSFLSGTTAEAEETVAKYLVPAGATPSEVRQETARVVGPALTPERVERLYTDLPRRDPWRPYIALQYAHVQCDNAKPDPCFQAATFASAEAPEPAWREDASKLVELVKAWRDVKAETIGVMLPLSGKYGAIGQAAKQGIELALEGFPSVKIVWRDTAGDAELAGKAAQELILDEHVTALLGPVGRVESSAATEVSKRFGVPHVVLSSDEDVAAEASTIVRLRLSPDEQARAIARYAMSELHGRRVGILYPQNDSGETLMGAFWDEVLRLGGEVYAVEGYEPGTTEFSPVLKDLLAASKPGKGDTEFAALFIPDGALSVRRLLPFLKYWGVPVKTTPGRGSKTVQLLGAAGWNHPAVVDRGDNLSDNAVFVDAYYHDPDDPVVDRFAKQFYIRHQQRPLTFHAESYDAGAILAAAVAGVKGDDHAVRVEVLDRLFHTRNHQGATGLVTVLPGGAVARVPRVLTIDLDDIRMRLSEEEERAVRGQRADELEGGR